MLTILLASRQPERFQKLRAELSARHPVTFTQASSGRTSLAKVRASAVDLVIVDAMLGDMTGEELVRQLLEVNAMINAVLVSDTSPEVFHERTEGLGILMPLPPVCGKAEAIKLGQCLVRLGLLTDAQLTRPPH